MSELLEVGRITKPHGIRGEVIVHLLTDYTERVAPGAVLQTPRGPLTIVASRPHQGQWIVQVEGVADRNGAEALRGTVLRAEPLDDPDALWVHQLIGMTVQAVDGTDIGRITAVEANPASDLLVLDDGHLVPLTFYVSHADGVVVVDPPAGLLDL
ncbi:MAG: 16S rRNA processing protein RimM [Acidobacteria bacterium]|nr:16S rRNA processing protein RimM [Acidobacteriota bacterium]